ncbi:MAG: bifunctional riboflavin kinase/FMN adenylyltransferase [Anaerolineae bacterium]
MKVVCDLCDIPPISIPCSLTIGSLDGIHLGHQTLLKRLKELSQGGTSVALTFSNHPSEILSPEKATCLLTTLEHRLLLLEKAGVDLVILLEFTKKLSNLPYDIFLKDIKNALPFNSLVLGEGAAFGKEKKGNTDSLIQLGKEIAFHPEFIKKLYIGNQVVSSGRIRQHIMIGDLKNAALLLGRLFSIYSSFKENSRNRCHLFLQNQHLCLPPSGSYPILARTLYEECEGSLTLDFSTETSQVHLASPLSSDSGMIEIIFK